MSSRAILRPTLLLLLLASVAALRVGPKAPRAAPSTAHTADSSRRGALGLLGAAALSLVLPGSPAAHASEELSERTIGEIPASGIIFKDIVKIERVNDPKVKGVELYVSDFQRPLTERITNDFFSDPATAALSCVRTGKLELDPSIDTSVQGEEVFQQARSLLFKSINVRRLYDREANALVYVAYSTRLNKADDENKSRFKTSMCVVKVD